MILRVFFPHFSLTLYQALHVRNKYHSPLAEGTWALGSNPYFCQSLFN